MNYNNLNGATIGNFTNTVSGNHVQGATPVTKMKSATGLTEGMLEIVELISAGQKDFAIKHAARKGFTETDVQEFCEMANVKF